MSQAYAVLWTHRGIVANATHKPLLAIEYVLRKVYGEQRLVHCIGYIPPMRPENCIGRDVGYIAPQHAQLHAQECAKSCSDPQMTSGVRCCAVNTTNSCHFKTQIGKKLQLTIKH